MYSVTDMDTRDRPWAGHHQFIKRDLYRFIKNDLKQLREVKQSFIAYVVPQFYNTDNINIIGAREKFCWGGGGAEHNLPEWNLLVTDAQDDSFVTSSFLRHAVRARAFKIVQIFSVNRDEHF